MIEELAKKKIPVLDLGNGVTSDKIAAAALAQYYYAGATAGKYLAETFPAGSGKKKMVWLAGPGWLPMGRGRGQWHERGDCRLRCRAGQSHLW